MAVVLGISSGPHDSGACLLRGGALLWAASEERFTRRKQDGRFPSSAIAFCLEAEGLCAADVDIVAHGWRFGASAVEVRRIAERVAEERTTGAVEHLLEVARRYEEVDANVAARVREGVSKLGIPLARLRTYDHHLCHAAASLYLCPYLQCGPGERPWAAREDEALERGGCCCVTLDGRGDFAAGKVITFSSPGTTERPAAGVRVRAPEALVELQVIDSTTMYDSLGFLWAFVTAVLGFKPFRHEGKVMGLAASGVAERTLAIFEGTMGLVKDPNEEGRWRIRSHWQAEALGNFQLYLAGLERPPLARQRLQDFELFKHLAAHRREDVAAGLQSFTESLILAYLERNGFARPLVCLAGGVFANVRLNMRLRTDLLGVRRVFVFPNMGDGGLCAGAAALAARDMGLLVTAPKGNVFLGPEFNAGQVREALGPLLKQPGAREFQEPRAFAQAVAVELHAFRRIVGLFQGAMEFGPRALGHRSLLAPATDTALSEALNGRLCRSEFMPFAPVTLRRCAAEAYCGWEPEDAHAGAHMTTCYEVTPAMRQLCPAVVHVDGTARPQVVDERSGLYFDILESYMALSGVHTLINTSFNVHEEPIVCTPSDAVQAFKSGACDLLASFPFLVACHSP